ncbi:MAG: NAD(+) synthase [Odoribacteraceae bacterium]|jgi:NAD+ synthase|nr:NAD(+) synthase [Odoribacteraceae bacterium]
METKAFVIDERNVASYARQIAEWIREQVANTRKAGIVLGISGGVDSAVVARLCQLARVDVHLLVMPYGDDMARAGHLAHVMELVETFRFRHHLFDIRPAVDALAITAPFNDEDAERLAMSRANLRPRTRMTYLYQVAQLENRLVAGTGNLAERTVGYFTKWGDGACDLNPLAMLVKKEVYALARYLGVPAGIIDKRPSAGLWEGQADEDELGITYAQIDAYILNGTSDDPAVDEAIERRADLSAHKFEKTPVFE